MKSVSDLKFRNNMYLGRKLQEEFIFFYQKESVLVANKLAECRLSALLRWRKISRGMIALDYAGCTLHPKLAFQFAKHLFDNLKIEKQTEP